MRHLFSKWDKIEKLFRDKFILILLDFDGTLSPIRETPAKANVPKETKELLRRLSESPFCELAVISGRPVNDLKEKLDLSQVIYSGNHGLELEGPKIKFKAQVPAKYVSILRKIKEELQNKLSAIKGVLLEDKGFSLGLHYRLVDEKGIPAVKDIFKQATIAYVAENNIKIVCGKMVLEVRPPVEWDKGRAALWLLARQQFKQGRDKVLSIYIGDDITDEDAFRVLENKGLTVFVGSPRKSSAQYYLKNTKEVVKFLKQILGLKNKE